jgi:hypothetical protein
MGRDDERSGVPTCAHLIAVPLTPTPADFEPICINCAASGDHWLHLRRCLTCETVHCCDSSPNRHASAHAQATGHPVVASAEPGEHWRWCYIDEVGA